MNEWPQGFVLPETCFEKRMYGCRGSEIVVHRCRGLKMWERGPM